MSGDMERNYRRLVDQFGEEKLTKLLCLLDELKSVSPYVCSGLMKPDTHLGENARQIEVSDDQTTPYLFR